MSFKKAAAFCLLLLACGTSCIDLGLGATVSGTPFIVQGTFELRENWGDPCPVWVEETGVIFQLFQGEDISNDVYDQVTTVGATSRLKIAIRRDLPVGCNLGTTVEVREVLEVNGVAITTGSGGDAPDLYDLQQLLNDLLGTGG